MRVAGAVCFSVVAFCACDETELPPFFRGALEGVVCRVSDGARAPATIVIDGGEAQRVTTDNGAWLAFVNDPREYAIAVEIDGEEPRSLGTVSVSEDSEAVVVVVDPICPLPPPRRTEGDVAGAICNRRVGLLLANATVTAGTTSTTTDEAGAFSFSASAFADRLQIVGDGYRRTFPLRLVEEGVTRFDLAAPCLPVTPDTGCVAFTTCEGLVGADVVVSSADVSVVDRIDVTGSVEVCGLVAGAWDVRVTSDDFAASEPVTITQGVTTTFRLARCD